MSTIHESSSFCFLDAKSGAVHPLAYAKDGKFIFQLSKYCMIHFSNDAVKTNINF